VAVVAEDLQAMLAAAREGIDSVPYAHEDECVQIVAALLDGES
jgi:hypothetical protein